MPMVRYILIGAAVAVSYLLLYLAFLALGLPRGGANALAFGLAVCLQYAGHAGVTFRTGLSDPQQMWRFAAMVGLGFATSTLITSGLGPATGLGNGSSAVVVTLVLPVQNFILMTLWVFAQADQRRGTLS